LSLFFIRSAPKYPASGTVRTYFAASLENLKSGEPTGDETWAEKT
jgi:hypothetical protein